MKKLLMSNGGQFLFPTLVVDAGLEACCFFLANNGMVQDYCPSEFPVLQINSADIATHTFKPQQGLCESIDEELSTFLQTHSTSIKQLKSVICCIGPGSFTGLRTGMSFCRAISQVLEIPIILISNMYAAAFHHYCKTGEKKITVISSANKDEYFYAEYMAETFIDFAPTRAVVAVKKESVNSQKCILLEELALSDVGKGFLQSSLFAHHLMAHKVLTSNLQKDKFFHQIQYITEQTAIIEPLYVKSVVAKTLEERGVKSLLDQD